MTRIIRVASMEPCLFRHGKVSTAGHAVRTAQLQWSHVFSDMVRLRRCSRPSIQYLRFNGAMSFQTW